MKLLVALATESLERRFDSTFGVTRTESEQDDRLTQRIQQLETELERLGEGFPTDDRLPERD